MLTNPSWMLSCTYIYSRLLHLLYQFGVSYSNLLNCLYFSFLFKDSKYAQFHRIVSSCTYVLLKLNDTDADGRTDGSWIACKLRVLNFHSQYNYIFQNIKNPVLTRYMVSVANVTYWSADNATICGLPRDDAWTILRFAIMVCMVCNLGVHGLCWSEATL